MPTIVRHSSMPGIVSKAIPVAGAVGRLGVSVPCARRRARKDATATLAVLLLAIAASSGASAQAMSEPLRGVEVVSEATRAVDAKRRDSRASSIRWTDSST